MKPKILTAKFTPTKSQRVVLGELTQESLSPSQARALIYDTEPVGLLQNAPSLIVRARALRNNPAFDLLSLEAPELCKEISSVLKAADPALYRQLELRQVVIEALIASEQCCKLWKSKAGDQFSRYSRLYPSMLLWSVLVKSEYVEQYGDDEVLAEIEDRYLSLVTRGRGGIPRMEFASIFQETAKRQGLVLESVLLHYGGRQMIWVVR